MPAATSEAKQAAAMHPEEVAKAVWVEINKLVDEIPPPPSDSMIYPDSRAADAFQAADQAVANLCAVPREQMLDGFTKLVNGPRLESLLDALVKSDQHPALQHSCLMVMCGVASLARAHEEVTKRRDVLKALLGALAKPKSHRISPQGAEEELDVNPAVGAAICLNSLLVSCGGLSDDTVQIWAELDALSAITSALEAHAVFEGGGDEDVLPAMLFGLATPLLLSKKGSTRTKQLSQQQSAENGADTPPPPPAEASAEPGPIAGDAASPSTDTCVGPETEKASMAARQRLAEAFLRLLAERREWVARSLAMAANATPSDLSGGAAPPAAVTINNLLVNSLAHPNLLGPFTGRAPIRLRAQAVAAARACEADNTFATGFAQQLARLLGLSRQQDNTRRMAGLAMDKVVTKDKMRKSIRCARPAPACRKVQTNGSEKFKACSRCKKAMYCSGACQAAHWKEGHKAECKKK